MIIKIKIGNCNDLWLFDLYYGRIATTYFVVKYASIIDEYKYK